MRAQCRGTSPFPQSTSATRDRPTRCIFCRGTPVQREDRTSVLWQITLTAHGTLSVCKKDLGSSPTTQCKSTSTWSPSILAPCSSTRIPLSTTSPVRCFKSHVRCVARHLHPKCRLLGWRLSSLASDTCRLFSCRNAAAEIANERLHDSLFFFDLCGSTKRK